MTKDPAFAWESLGQPLEDKLASVTADVSQRSPLRGIHREICKIVYSGNLFAGCSWFRKQARNPRVSFALFARLLI